MRSSAWPNRILVWREDSARSDLDRLAKAINRMRRKTFQRTFRITLCDIPPPKRMRWDQLETQRIVTLRR